VVVVSLVALSSAVVVLSILLSGVRPVVVG
jgi:hypothetical protein